MTIPKDVILIWTGTYATIPANWSQEPNLVDLFPKGHGSVIPNQIGGSSTHTHTSPAHSHSIAAHTHSIVTSTVNAGSYNGKSSSVGAMRGSHYHTGQSGAVSSGGDTSSDTTTYASVSNDPPYRKVIFIKANAGAQLATGIVALWGESDTAPSNWSKVTELSGRYLKGAGTGADADLTTDNGSSTNVHSITHNHTSTSAHSHANSTSNTATGIIGYVEETAGSEIMLNHNHTLAINSATAGISETTTSLTTSETVEPEYRQLHAIKKEVAGIKEKGIIGLWLGGTAQIPSGWSLYTPMNDKHLKIGNPTTSATGGSNTHTHAAQGHTHTGAAHTHSGSSISAHSNSRIMTGTANVSNVAQAENGNHTFSSISNDTTNYASADTTANSANNEPAYRTVAFIQLVTEQIFGGMF